jgi:pyruvate formate lyase activating enzyme
MSTRGIVFDIQRASLHDGPGIRTTVFLKGCTAHCLWCHNPESIPFDPSFSFDPEKCRLCGACAAVCPESVHSFGGGVHRVSFADCTLCGVCIPACPEGCLRIIGREYTAVEVMAEVRRDHAFYDSSGGGLTISGGEPTAQIEFLCELTAAARAEGIHTCVDTAGGGARKDLERLLPSVDLFLFDYKDSEAGRLKVNTGLTLGVVDGNLRFLLERGAAVILRCPVIPGINDTRDHFMALVSLQRGYPGLRGIELLPYHDLGLHKAARIGEESRLAGFVTTPRETTEQWRAIVAELGGTRIKVA